MPIEIMDTHFQPGSKRKKFMTWWFNLMDKWPNSIFEIQQPLNFLLMYIQNSYSSSYIDIIENFLFNV